VTHPDALPDPAWTAFQTGLKPALRLSMPLAAGERYAARLAAARVPVAVGPRPVELGGELRLLIYVAGSRAYAERLRDAETGPGAYQRASLEATGLLLGYPRCCVDAYLSLAVRQPGNAPHDDFRFARAALAATAGGPDWRLNTLVRGARTRLVEHYPCRFDCPASLAYATAVERELRRLAPAATDLLARTLAVRMLVAPDGRRRADPDLAPEPGEIAIDFRQIDDGDAAR
jgi:hypothetical protein